MALKTSISRGSWAAVEGSGLERSGIPIVTSDAQITNVSSNPGGENPFFTYHMTLGGSIGSNKPTTTKRPWFTAPGPSSFGEMPYLDVSAVSWSAANLWARSHPLRPVVRLPVFWLELREIPDMIRQAGRFLLAGKNWKRYVRNNLQTRDLATANLAFQFGWVPLIGDLYKLAHFTDEVDKRRKRLEAGTKAGTFRTSFTLGKNTISGAGSRAANFGAFVNFSVAYKYSGHSISWATMKWRPTKGGGGLPTKDNDLRPHLLGLHPSQMVANLWEALPWSWLVDYFSNIGDIVEAGNHHTVTPAGGSVMTKSVTTISHLASESVRLKLSPGIQTQVTHRRTPATSSSAPSLSMPTLGTGQLSILGSLATIRGGKKLGLR